MADPKQDASGWVKALLACHFHPSLVPFSFFYTPLATDSQRSAVQMELKLLVPLYFAILKGALGGLGVTNSDSQSHCAQPELSTSHVMHDVPMRAPKKYLNSLLDLALC